MSNAVFRKKGETAKHYIEPGNKQLVHETTVNDISVFSVHLPTVRHFRRRQLKNLIKLASKREKTVICGDFNTYWGTKELKNLLKETDLVLKDPGPTNPSHRPSRHLDYFLTSEELDVKKCETIESTFSDHRPVTIEVKG
jgi:endonuclease/exonuclease/phosphatase family metal-dependent hydrolase